jgi:hypothetical protein
MVMDFSFIFPQSHSFVSAEGKYYLRKEAQEALWNYVKARSPSVLHTLSLSLSLSLSDFLLLLSNCAHTHTLSLSVAYALLLLMARYRRKISPRRTVAT